MRNNSQTSSTRTSFSGDWKGLKKSEDEWDNTSYVVQSNSVGLALKDLPRIISKSILGGKLRSDDDDFFRAEDVEYESQ
jgi:hypothetical protein